MRPVSSLTGSVVCAIVLLSCVLAAAVHAAEPPRYSFEAGQEIGYRSESKFKFGTGEEAGTFLDTMDYTVWVVRKNEDDTWRIVIRKVTTGKRLDHDGKERIDPPQKLYAYADMAADGEFAHNETLRGLVSWLFPRLPPAAEDRIWGARYDWDQTQLRYRRDDNQPDGALRFREFRTTLLDPVYLFKWDTVYTFGVKEGLLLNAEQKFAQGVGFVGEGTEQWSLTYVKRHEPAWAEQLAREAERLFSARRGDLAISTAISSRPRDAATVLANSKKAMEEVLAKCETAEALEMCRHYLEQLKADEEYYLGQAKKYAELLDRPAPSWETTDWDGKKYALADFQGKVVVLDFWYRGCGWCIRAMPQVKQLHEEFKDQAVAVLGMCADAEEENARFVADYLNLAYPTLKGEGIQEQYGDGGWPTLVLIDQQGIVRKLHVGYSPTLREEMAVEIKALLKERE